MAMTDNDRLIGICISHSQLGSILTRNGLVEITTPLPKTARLVRAYYDADCKSVVAIFNHSSFEVVQEGEAIPIAKGFEAYYA